MSSIEELKAKHGEREYPQSPLRVCPNCFLVDYHSGKAHMNECSECRRWSDEGFPVEGSAIASAMVLEAVREAVAKDQRALNAWMIIVDDWEWKA